MEYGTESFAEALTYFPEPKEFRLGPEEYLEHVAQAKQAVRIPSWLAQRLLGGRLD